MTRFEASADMGEMACFMSFPPTCHTWRKRLETSLFPRQSAYGGKDLFYVFSPTPKEPGEKPTYYVREGKVLQVALSPSSHSHTKPQRTFQPTTRKLTTMDRISLTLPYPPSVNHYWQTRVVRRGARYVPSVYVSEDGQRYRSTVVRVLDGAPRFEGRLRVQVLVQPPDQRARDLDNVLKCLLDSLTAAGVWHDDSQVDSLLVVRGDQTAGGAVLVLVESFDVEPN